MKKLLVLFVAVVATVSTFAANRTYFSKAQFMWSSKNVDWWANEGQNYDAQVTFPVVFKGTVAYAVDMIKEPTAGYFETKTERGRAQCVINKKKSYPAFMTMCQPCIECYPCDVMDVDDSTGDQPASVQGRAGVDYTGIQNGTGIGEPGIITLWNLYVVTFKGKENDNKVVKYLKINLADNTNPSIFFTGAQGKNGYVKEFNNGISLVAKKSAYSLKYWNRYLSTAGAAPAWENSSADRADTLKVTTFSSLTGYFYIYTLNGFTGDTTNDELLLRDTVGTVKLNRDSSWTGKAVKAVFTTQEAGICEPENPISWCEDYFYKTTKFEDEYFGATYKGYSKQLVGTDLFDVFYDDDVFDFDKGKAFNY